MPNSAGARQELIRCCETYPDLPREALVKADLLRLGIAFAPETVPVLAAAKQKSYFIFSFDRIPRAEMEEAIKQVLPEEIALIGGPWEFQRVIVSVRHNPASPYRVVTDRHIGEAGDARRGALYAASAKGGSAFGGSSAAMPVHGGGGRQDPPPLWLCLGNERLCEVHTEPPPAYYGKTLANGKPVIDLAPTIEWGYLIYITAFRLCQYWGDKEECRFCDINANYRQQRKEGRPYTGMKAPEDVVAALGIIAENDGAAQAYTVTGGSVLDQMDGLDEAGFYARYAEVIEEKFPGRWIGKAVVQALPSAQVKQLKKAGYQIYHPNYEVWDKRIFTWLCPGKDRYIGRDEWHRRILDAAEVFGPTHVIPNFVAGIEMAKPHGFTNVDDAISSTAEGLDFYMAKGICPRFTVWCVEPNTGLAESEPAPLEYYARLLQTYRATFRRHKLPIPPGYGEAGLGHAVFSVSSFMDVLP
ncbi:MAG: radical SAM protein [Deltaproteobacteria bacterium]|nr:radical SAM protein [Deltaproteobacteria bacterium]